METDKVSCKITADLVESQKLIVPEMCRDGGLWNALGPIVRPEALREDCRNHLSSCISDLRPTAAGSLPSQK